MNRKNNIILIGFMGSGKTTFGRWITRTHNMEFLDTDEYIENKYNKLIKDIFRDSGEETFRDMETQAIKELAQVCDNCVISVGGGLPVREVNRSLLKELGIVVYLEASVDELYGDTKDDDWKQEEVARLKAEQGISDMEEPALNMESDGFTVDGADNNFTGFDNK